MHALLGRKRRNDTLGIYSIVAIVVQSSRLVVAVVAVVRSSNEAGRGKRRRLHNSKHSLDAIMFISEVGQSSVSALGQSISVHHLVSTTNSVQLLVCAKAVASSLHLDKAICQCFLFPTKQFCSFMFELICGKNYYW